MASNEGNSGPGIQGMLNAALAVMMVAGGLFLASRKLTSDRPSNPADTPTAGMGWQEVEARLWEDPMSAAEKLPPGEHKQRKEAGLGPVYRVIEDAAKQPTNSVLVLGVMLPGEPYAEDKEKRIRLRYSVVSALGVCGFKPEDSSHLGIAISPWPDRGELAAWMTNQSGADLRIVTTNETFALLGTNSRVDLRLPFERFQARTFYPQTNRTTSHRSVVVLWLDEERFGEEPLVRLALLFDRVTQNANVTTALLGPRSSATLRLMMPGELEGRRPISLSNANLWFRMTNVFRRMQICLNTASAMDEVLVGTNEVVSAADFAVPRLPVQKALLAQGFNKVLNFSCTDAQLSSEILAELQLRGVNPAGDPKDFVAVISEWDSFYGRMTAVSFAAEVARQSPTGTSRLDFRNQLQHDNATSPSNVLRYVYLRGLDGESADGKAGKSSRAGDERNGRKIPTSVEDIRRWSPDANKAEGAAQFDYLARLGEMIREKDRDLQSRGLGRIKAVGVMGSDVYDTLLILQALRRQLPEALYFTTELDVRMWNPDELEWSRNLLVASSYGLQLAEALQKDTPPFRDAAQCATYAGTLGILGFPGLDLKKPVSARRFEISRQSAYDLSVTDEGGKLNPKAPGQSQKPTPGMSLVLPLLMAAAALCTLLIYLSDSLNRLVWRTDEFRVEPLEFREEDFGGVFGAQKLMLALHEDRWKNDPLAVWLKAHLELSGTAAEALPADPGDWPYQVVDGVLAADAEWTGKPDHKTEEVLQKMIATFNRLLFPRAGGRLPHQKIVRETGLLSPELKGNYLEALATVPRSSTRSNDPDTVSHLRVPHAEVFQNRRVVDEILNRLTAPSLDGPPCALPAKKFDATAAAFCSRKAAEELYRLRCQHVFFFRLAAAAGGLGLLLLMWMAWFNTFGVSQGEPFAFNGISVWPAEFIRYGVLFLCLGMVLEARRSLREAILDITRRFRLCLSDLPGKRCFDLPRTSPVAGAVDANHLWAKFQQVNRWQQRIPRALLTTTLYLAFGMMLTVLCGFPSRPVRGTAMSGIDFSLLLLAVLSFLFLTFWMIDATRFCRWFIGSLSGAPTSYPQATLEHFARKRAIGESNYALLDEWIDLNLIADLTERVGRFVYLPFIIFFLMLVSRTTLWDRWTWPWSLVVIFTGNLILAGTSSFILQRAAAKARETGAENLKDKVNDARKSASPTPTAHAAQQGEELLAEIQNLRRGAFVSAWRAPLVGALLVPSTGTIVLQLLAVFFNR